MRGVAAVLLAVLLSLVLVGLTLFSLLTRRFRRLTRAVQSFHDGRYDRRVEINADDEISGIGRAVNEMVGTIQAQVEALRRTDDDRRNLVANISHDFRTPLTSLRGYARRLAERGNALDEEARRECLDAVLSNTERLEYLADQLASLSQLDSNGHSAQMEPFSLVELLQDVILEFRPFAEEEGVLLEASYPPTPNVYGDIALIERALSNLIDNALRNTPQGGRAKINLQAESDSVRLTVADSGCGIAADELALVTQRFYRTEHSRSSAMPGSGLGLAIAREIVELHDSALLLESKVGLGTSAHFTLQAAP